MKLNKRNIYIKKRIKEEKNGYRLVDTGAVPQDNPVRLYIRKVNK